MDRLTQVTVIRDDRSLMAYKPGEVGRPFPTETTWYIACPACGGKASLINHEVTENADGTITLSPSLRCFGSIATPCAAHYFVENNQIRWI